MIEKTNKLIETLPRGILTFYNSDKGRKLSSDEYKIVCNNTKIITQRAIMGANIIDNKAFDLYNKNLKYMITDTNGKILINSYDIKSLINKINWKGLKK